MAVNNVNITISLPKDIVSWLERKSVQEERNRSQVVRNLLRREMNKEAENKLKKGG